MVVKILDNDSIKDRVTLILQLVDVSAQAHQIRFQLRSDVLPNTPGADAVAGAMVTVPVLVFQDLVQVVLVIGPKAKSAEFTIAFVINVLLSLLAFRRQIRVEIREKVGEKGSQLNCELKVAERIKVVRINVQLLQPR
jgi:hypothetical protein